RREAPGVAPDAAGGRAAPRSFVVAGLAKGRMLRVEARLLGDLDGLAFDERRDRRLQRRVADPVGAVREGGREPAFQLVLALGAGFEQRVTALDRALDQAVVTELEVQHLKVVQAAPV